ncbi:unnamed protein product, partial [Urochloa humidicola]
CGAGRSCSGWRRERGATAAGGASVEQRRPAAQARSYGGVGAEQRRPGLGAVRGGGWSSMRSRGRDVQGGGAEAQASEMLQESNISKFKSQVQNSQVSPSSYGQHWVSTWVSTCRKKRLADGGISASGEHANLK